MMKDAIKGGTLAAATAALFAVGAASPAGAADYVLKYGHPGPVGEDSDDHVAGEFLKSFLETRSNGQIEVQIFPGSQLGSFREMVEQVNAGTLEIAHTALGGLVGFMPELQVIELPYIIRDDMVAECMIDGPFFEDMRKGFLEKSGNVNLIGVGNTGRFRNFFTASAPVKSARGSQGREDAGDQLAAPSRHDGILWRQPDTCRLGRALHLARNRRGRGHQERGHRHHPQQDG